MLDDLPLIVGVGQLTERSEDRARKREPLRLMEEAARLALDDTRAAGVRDHLDSVRVVNMLSASYADPAGALAEALGLAAGERLYTTIGGNSPQWLVNRSADDLATGRIRATLIAGAEAMHALRVAIRAGATLPWAGRRRRAAMIGDDRQGSHPDEWTHGAQMPAHIYPLFEIALRAHEHRRPAAHAAQLAALSASLAQVAAANPHAWFRDAKSAEEIGAVSDRNRMIAFPYPKFMNAMLEVDQAAAVVMTTVAGARTLGIPRDRWIFVHGCGEAHDIWWVKDRVDYHSSPGMALAFTQALRQAGLAPADLDLVDLYSCFPVAVEIAARLLDLPTDGSRPLTVTGGLPYFGGPGNNYTLHAIATMVERLRATPGERGLVSGLGWYLTKHAVGIYGTSPPTRPWQVADRATPQAPIDALAHPTCVPEANGDVRIETYSVMHDREGGMSGAMIIARTLDGDRVLAVAPPDLDFLAVLEREEMVGARGRVTRGGDGRNHFVPAGGG